MRATLYCLAILVVAATLIPLLKWSDWWIRAFDFPRPQFALAGIAIVGVYVWFWDIKNVWQGLLFTVLVICVAYQAWRMFPYTPLAQKQVVSAKTSGGENSISLLVSNVLMTNRNATDLIAIIHEERPDVVLAVETDETWRRNLEPLHDDYPYRTGVALDNTYGMLLYSKLELIDPAVRYLVNEEVPSIRTRIRLLDGRSVYFYGVHPEPPSPTEAPDTVERDAELLIVAKEIADRDRPTIVAGDLNDVAWSDTTSMMQRISRLLDPRIGRGLHSTFHAKIPFLRWPLDHVFHSDEFRLVKLDRLPKIGSDHFPILIELDLDPSAALLQEAPAPEADDAQEAEEKIEEAFEQDGGSGDGDPDESDPNQSGLNEGKTTETV